MTETAIHTENLTRDFGQVRAVDGVSLAVPAGTIFGFLGRNGAGKTTMIHLLLGLLEPTAGQASVLGFDTRTHGNEIRARIGALLGHSGLYERLSAEDNLEFSGRIWRLRASERRDRIAVLLRRFGLWERRQERVGTWSRGMQQKLAIARALIHRPSLIFLDEPTAGLDPVAAAALRDDLADMVAREGVTVFLTTHNLAEAEKLCGEVGVIRDGKLLAIGRPDDLRSRGGNTRVEIVARGLTDEIVESLRAQPQVVAAEVQNGSFLLELKGDADVAPLVSLIVTSGAAVEEVRREKASLEDAFLALMVGDK